MSGASTIADALTAFRANLAETFEGEVAPPESARAAINDVMSLVRDLEAAAREEPDGLARGVVQLARSRPTLLVEVVRHLRQWSNDIVREVPPKSHGSAGGYVKSEAPGSAFLSSDLEDGENLSAVSGSSAVVQGEEVDSKHIASG
ncbi:MAG: hypothetical protein QM784_11050 [Polyangiaceae bacterium]